MNPVQAPQSRCRVGVARCDITPPVGIYHRMWGAALHDRSTAVHRPLLATLLWLERLSGAGESPQLLIAVDHCIFEREEIERIQQAVSDAVAVPPGQVHVSLSHTHGAGLMSRSRGHLPGGEMIGPYLDDLARRLGELAVAARGTVVPGVIIYGTGRCALAAHRDLWDADHGRFVCGFNPDGPADDTVLVARITASDGRPVATVVNYACHPTTLAWENTAISPDYVGAMRATVESVTGVPCLFLQGASGDLGPREGFVGDAAVADRNGRQLGYAAQAALEALPPAGTEYVYRGPVVSGAVLGPWDHRPSAAATLDHQSRWEIERWTVPLPYRHDLPTPEATREQQARWQAEEEAARAAGDEARVRDARARVEQMTRQLTRLALLPPGRTFPYPVNVLRLGDAFWILVPGELYQVFQTTLRARFPGTPLVIAAHTGGWQPGYLPSAASYGYGIYQETIAAVGPGSLEILMEEVARHLRRKAYGAALHG
jgi:hypothetical protein